MMTTTTMTRKIHHFLLLLLHPTLETFDRLPIGANSWDSKPDADARPGRTVPCCPCPWRETGMDDHCHRVPDINGQRI
jgi:hypothetical protein